MRLGSDLRDVIECWVDLIREEYPGQNAQSLLAAALRSTVIRQEITEQINWLVDHREGAVA